MGAAGDRGQAVVARAGEALGPWAAHLALAWFLARQKEPPLPGGSTEAIELDIVLEPPPPAAAPSRCS